MQVLLGTGAALLSFTCLYSKSIHGTMNCREDVSIPLTQNPRESSVQHADSIIHAGWIIPVEPDQTVLKHHSLVIRHGLILDILPTRQCQQKYSANIEDCLLNHILVPGFVNTHTHAAMNLLRGYADDLPLMQWLSEHIWPAEKQWVDYEFVQQGTELAIAEMLRSGTTTFNDMYFFPDAAAKAVHQTGIRAVMGLIIIDFPSAWAQDSEEYLHKGLEVHEQYRHHPLISTTLAPHAPYTVGDESLQRVKTYAAELDIPIHIHLHETRDEVEQAVKNSGARPIERLRQLDLLSPRLLAVHMTQLQDDEIQLLKEHEVNVIHCPESNLKLASGFCQVHSLLERSINVAIGTDGAAANNDLDMLGEMRSAALLSKAVAQDAAAVPAFTALKMATLNGAIALGLDTITGSLVNGKAADITAIELNSIESLPLYNPVSQLVYSSCRDQVTDVWVQGKHLLNKRRLTTLDEQQLLITVEHWQNKILNTNSKQAN